MSNVQVHSALGIPGFCVEAIPVLGFNRKIICAQGSGSVEGEGCMFAAIVLASAEMWMLPALGISWLGLGLMIGKVLYRKPGQQPQPSPPRSQFPPQPQPFPPRSQFPPHPMREVTATGPGAESRVHARFE